MATDDPPHLPVTGSVEQLLRIVLEVPNDTSSFGVWVPLLLTWRGEAATWDDASKALREVLLAKGFVPRRPVEHPTRRYWIFDQEFL